MREILEKYSTRLINVSGKNRSLVTRKLYKKRAFDIVKLDKFNSGLSKEIIKFLCERKEKPFEILEDPYKWYTQEYDKLKESMDQEKKKALEKLKASGKEYTNEDVKALEDNHDQKFIEADEKLKYTKEVMVGYSSSVKALIRQVKQTEKETGRYELFIGYPFVEML